MASCVRHCLSRRRGLTMKNGFAGLLGILAMGLTLIAQTPKPAAKPYTSPRTPDGHPDLQGTYDLATLTPLERPAGTKAVLTEDEAAKLERDIAARRDQEGRPTS